MFSGSISYLKKGEGFRVLGVDQSSSVICGLELT